MTRNGDTDGTLHATNAHLRGRGGSAPWIDRFAGLSRLPDDIKKTLTDSSQVVSVPAGTVVFGPGHIPDNLLLLLEGSVRVSQTSEQGREIVLYRVEAGQSCVLTTACLLAHEAYAAEGIAETDVKAVAIPRATFDDLVSRAPLFRDFVFTAYSRRITDLFRVVDEVAFGRIDMRLAERLLTLSRDGDEVKATHQQLATELGTAREVISRQLQEFQRRGWIEQERGRILLHDRKHLTALRDSL
ncbi:Crp/Fnr family transcriptional regulator [Aestuariicoccus sp. MJ-SS9]|uniref:Crp/Fnr family transcriptional regulator n=1 Tax=Aestuariicoccus sp. MJ-SS9 TaxID=3079855 RepID=UPI00290C0138|nr:Crp/Fnr family transcriptional regulator [Aestuariicoccus sp. MJ-SS9]MDU8910030.1 Crp/Fnr family transcriptional regulator [Aestuariicoccus sp. MJ-SS9]